jgi:hypothetical protein
MTVASAGASASIRSGGPGPRAAATATRSLAAATATRSKRHLGRPPPAQDHGDDDSYKVRGLHGADRPKSELSYFFNF